MPMIPFVPPLFIKQRKLSQDELIALGEIQLTRRSKDAIMIKWLQYLIYGHVHKWNIIEQGPLHNKNDTKVGTYYNLQCGDCGNMKVKNLV